MEENVPDNTEHSANDGGTSALATTLDQQRETVRQQQHQRRQRLGELRDTLTDRFFQVCQSLEEDRAELNQKQSEFEARISELETQRAELEQVRADLEAVQQQHDQNVAELDAQREDLERREAELAQSLQELETQRAELEQLQQQHQAAVAELEQQQQALADAQTRLDEQQAAFEAEKQASVDQQQALDDQSQCVEEQLAEQRQSLETRESELTSAQHQLAEAQQSLADAQQESQDRQNELDQRAAELGELQEALDLERQRLSALQEELQNQALSEAEESSGKSRSDDQLALEMLRNAHAEQCERLHERTEELQTAKEEVEVLQKHLQEVERRFDEILEKEVAKRLSEASGGGGSSLSDSDRAELEDRIETLEEELAAARSGSSSSRGNDDDDYADLQRRHEMLLDDLRELKAENRELKSKGGSAAPAKPSGGGMDWEAQKQKLLASLEEDFDEDDADDRRERIKIDEVIRNTDRIIREKDAEIRELQQLLDQQSANVGDVAIGAAAIAATLDQDEVITHERERLKALQEEWREKLRKAEIDISVERAKIARERNELEEKLRVLEQQQHQHQSATPEQNGKRKTGNWLSRLGLKDSDE